MMSKTTKTGIIVGTGLLVGMIGAGICLYRQRKRLQQGGRKLQRTGKRMQRFGQVAERTGDRLERLSR